MLVLVLVLVLGELASVVLGWRLVLKSSALKCHCWFFSFGKQVHMWMPLPAAPGFGASMPEMWWPIGLSCPKSASVCHKKAQILQAQPSGSGQSGSSGLCSWHATEHRIQAARRLPSPHLILVRRVTVPQMDDAIVHVTL